MKGHLRTRVGIGVAWALVAMACGKPAPLSSPTLLPIEAGGSVASTPRPDLIGSWQLVSLTESGQGPLTVAEPERFTVEFDFVTNDKASRSWPLLLNMSAAESNWESQGASNAQVRFGTRDGGVYAGKIEAKGPANGDFQNTVVHARLMADGKYTKVYINGVRVGNGPNADLGRSTAGV